METYINYGGMSAGLRLTLAEVYLIPGLGRHRLQVQAGLRRQVDELERIQAEAATATDGGAETALAQFRDTRFRDWLQASATAEGPIGSRLT
jgi:hypothetical protein